MTVSSTLNRVAYTGDGVTLTFPYTFLALVNTDLQVYVNGVLKTITADYTVSGVGSPTGGNVVFVVAPANLAAIVILRVLPETQASALPANDKFPSTTVETAFDKLTMITQQLSEVDKRALVLGVSSAFSNLILPDPLALNYLRWKSDLSGLENASVSGIGTIAAALAAGRVVIADGAASITTDPKLLWDATLSRFAIITASAAPLTVGADASAAFLNLVHASRTWRFKRQAVANFQSSNALTIDNDGSTGLQLHLLDKTGGQRVWIWDSGSTGPVVHPHTGGYPAFAVQGDVTLGDVITFSPAGNAWVVGMRTATALTLSAITHLMCSSKTAGVEPDGGAGVDLYPTDNAAGATNDGIVELLAYGRGSAALANSIFLSSRSGANAILRRWQMGGPGNVGDLFPFASNTYRLGTLALAPKSVAASAGTGTGTGHAIIVLAQDTAVGTGCTNNNNENDLKTYTLPLNSLATDGDMLRITMSFRCAANGTTKNIRIYFGGTVLLNSSVIALNNQIINVQLYITRTGASAQYCQGAVIAAATHDVWSTALVGDCKFPSDPAKNLAADQIIKATIQLGAGAAVNDVIQDMLIVEYLRKA
jgi:hypothetical protein